ncbi:MAG: Hydrolase, TatD family [Candidatus Moranbacteria bacterium GW2011_GWF1_36_4]|nr:MAG: Hydrolase, TatD family [Candidatus Moranbacteria bacterium GW2011_GWF1_36_4]
MRNIFTSNNFKKDSDAAIKRALSQGVRSIINVGTKIDSSQKAVELSEEYDELYAIVGVHPHHADKPGENWIQNLEELAKNKKVVAIGEVGLDYFKYLSNGIVEPKVQKEVFEKQIELAHRLNLPLQIHNRHAGEDIIEILKHHKNILRDAPGMFHCFAGSMEILRGALDLGFYIGFDGNITYKGLPPGESVSLPDIAKATPIDRIVTETDSPFLTPEPHRGTRNEPAYVIIVGNFIAEIKSLTFEEVRDQTTQNAMDLFGI